MVIPNNQQNPTWPTTEDLAAFSSPDNAEAFTPSLRAVLAETAVFGTIRYEWRYLKPLLKRAIEGVIQEFAAEAAATNDEIGPPRPLLEGGEEPDAAILRLNDMLDTFPEAPFTFQRLCELVLEPRKQYSRLDKLVVALEKSLNVTSTLHVSDALHPLPPYEALEKVNENPYSPYMVQQVQDNHQPEEGPQMINASDDQDMLNGVVDVVSAAIDNDGGGEDTVELMMLNGADNV